MTCPTEFTCAIFADGELPDAESRALQLHLEVCEDCRRLVDAFRAENRLLVQSLQDVDLEEAGQAPAFSDVQPLSIAKFGLGIVGVAAAFRITTGILFGFKLPAELEWLDPRGLALNLGWAVNAASYAIRNAGDLVNDTAQTVIALALGAAVLVGMSRVFSRSAAVSSVFLVLLAIGLFSPESHALDIRKGDAASIPAGTIIDDSVVASPDKTRRNIDIAGTIKGDLVVFGDLITIRGSVEGNVLAFARRVEISGTIGGSLVSAGQTVIVSGHVGRNLVGAGGTVTLGNAAEVASNVIAMAGEAVVEGKTGRDFGFFGGVLDMRGDIARHLVFRGGQASLGDTTRVGGDLIAFAQKEESVQIASGAVIQGKRNISPIPRPQAESRFLTARFYIWQIVRILAAFVAGLLLFKLVPWLAPAGIASGKQWLISGGIGFLVLVSVPLAAIIVGFTVIGLPVALISLALWAAGLYFSKIIVAEFVGRSIMNRGGAVPLLAGLLLVIFAVNLPWIGGLINFLLCLMGLGAIVMAIYRTRTWRGSGDPLAV